MGNAFMSSQAAVLLLSISFTRKAGDVIDTHKHTGDFRSLDGSNAVQKSRHNPLNLLPPLSHHASSMTHSLFHTVRSTKHIHANLTVSDAAFVSLESCPVDLADVVVVTAVVVAASAAHAAVVVVGAASAVAVVVAAGVVVVATTLSPTRRSTSKKLALS
jgi:hypothetical protein